MKLVLRYISIFAIALTVFSCDFDENGQMPDNMTETSFPYIIFDAEASAPFVNLTSPADYMMSGTIDVLFKEQVPFDKLRLVVVYNGAYDKPYTIEDNITTVPHDFTITSSTLIDIISELGSVDDMKADDKYHVYVIPTMNGEEFPPYQLLGGKAYNTVSSSILQNLNAFTGLNSADYVINVPCQLLPENMVGSYYMASDDWEAYGDVTIEADPNDPYKVYIYGIAAAEGLVDNGNGIEVYVDPDTYAASAKKTVLAADLAAWGLSYTNYYYEPVSANFNTCDGSYTFTFKIGVDQGSWGNFNYKFTRNDD